VKRHSRGSDLAAEAEAHPPHVETDTMARTKTRRDPQQPGGGLAPISDADLQSALREHLPGSGPHGVRWRRTFKRRQDWRGSRLFERVKVERPGADDLEVCLKYFAPAPGDGFPAPAALREARAYEFLNGLPSAGTARYFGQVHTPEARHSILVLEWVHGRRLKKIASVERWSAAGSWLGRLHGELSSSGLRHREDLALPRHDSTFFARWAERAARAAVERCPEAGPRLERLLRDYDGVVEALTSTEPTLVHGELYCTNIMLRGGPRGGFCPFDWETAAIGCGTLDLAYLGRQELGIQPMDLLRAYARGWADVALRPPSLQTLSVQHAAARVHERLYLVWSAATHRRVGEAKIWKYLDILEGLMGDLAAARAGDDSELP
jgi:aminoglycoside phosphotransferase (APT) family kinase protein